MAYYLTTHITIGKHTFYYANSVEIESTWQTLGDRCTIRLPNLSGQLGKSITIGNQVTIKLGYDGNHNTEFVGYVASIKPTIPFEITCEDELFTLKRMLVNDGNGKSWRSITLKKLLKELLAGIDYELSEKIPDVTLAPFSIGKNLTVAQALQKLKDDFVLVAYFREKKLFVGLAYTENIGDSPVKYDMSLNVVNSDLVFKRKEDVRLGAKAISLLKDNKRVEATVGDQDGEQRTLYFRGIDNAEELRELAEKELEKYRYEGYRGGFETFGVPFCKHGQTAIITDTRYPEREGSYVIDKVKTTWGSQGFRRKIALGIKINQL